MVKYSGGAKDDAPHVRESDENGAQYVTVATFRGNGPIIDDWRKP